MKMRYILVVFSCICLGLSSCKEAIDIKLNNSSPQLIIEGNVVDVIGTHSVNITRSVNFDAPNTFPGVSGATVRVTDNTTGQVYNFTERSPGVYSSSSIYGRLRRNYTLRAIVDGKTYTASSTMPSDRVVIDSITTSDPAFGGDDNKTVTVYYKDPPGNKNFYRIVMHVNGVQVKNIFVRNDEFTDGRMVNVKLYQSDIKIKSGDRVDVDMQGLDEPMYNYWFTFSRQNGQIGGSATPSNPPNNFDQPVLGYFSVRTNFRRSFNVR